MTLFRKRFSDLRVVSPSGRLPLQVGHARAAPLSRNHVVRLLLAGNLRLPDPSAGFQATRSGPGKISHHSYMMRGGFAR